jgi:hypothetical protein
MMVCDVIPFRRKPQSPNNLPTIEKMVDGEIIICVVVDHLTPEQWIKFFEPNSRESDGPDSRR